MEADTYTGEMSDCLMESHAEAHKHTWYPTWGNYMHIKPERTREGILDTKEQELSMVSW